VTTPQATPQPKRRAAPLIPVAETHEVPLDALTPFEFDSFFGDFFEPTEHAELAS
jgi:hypothetical protein